MSAAQIIVVHSDDTFRSHTNDAENNTIEYDPFAERNKQHATTYVHRSHQYL